MKKKKKEKYFHLLFKLTVCFFFFQINLSQLNVQILKIVKRLAALNTINVNSYLQLSSQKQLNLIDMCVIVFVVDNEINIPIVVFCQECNLLLLHRQILVFHIVIYSYTSSHRPNANSIFNVNIKWYYNHTQNLVTHLLAIM